MAEFEIPTRMFLSLWPMGKGNAGREESNGNREGIKGPKVQRETVQGVS